MTWLTDYMDDFRAFCRDHPSEPFEASDLFWPDGSKNWWIKASMIEDISYIRNHYRNAARKRLKRMREKKDPD